MAQWADSAFAAELGVNPGHTGLRGILASEESEVSMLYWLRYIRNARGAAGKCGVHDNLSLTVGGAQQDKIVGGAWGLAERIYREELGGGMPGSGRVHFHSAVTHVYDHETEAPRIGLPADFPAAGASVVTADGRVVTARAVVVAVPLSLSAHIRHVPATPTRSRAAAGSPMASVIKINMEFSRCFWRDAQFSGLAISDDGPVALTYDACVGAPGEAGSRAVLVAFCLGRSAREWGERPPAERREGVLRAVAALFNCGDEALCPTRYTEQDWCKEPHAGGGYVCVSPPGVLSNYGYALQGPAGLVHWCGADVAVEWQGYMEGALSSAEKAVAEVVAQLGLPAAGPSRQ